MTASFEDYHICCGEGCTNVFSGGGWLMVLSGGREGWLCNECKKKWDEIQDRRTEAERLAADRKLRRSADLYNHNYALTHAQELGADHVDRFLLKIMEGG